MAEAPHDSHTWMNGQDGESHGMCADCKAKQLERHVKKTCPHPTLSPPSRHRHLITNSRTQRPVNLFSRASFFCLT